MMIIYNCLMVISKFTELNPFQRSMVSALTGLLFYGSWAYLVNSMHGMAAAIKAACVQGGYSFALTFSMTLLIEAIYAQAAKVVSNPFALNWGTISLSCGVVFSGSWWVNVMAGTPEIFDTVILGYIVGGIYTIAYVFGLAHGRRTNSI